MARRLLVGVAEADELNEPRRFLLDRLELLTSLGVEVQVAMFAEGPVRRDLEALADVRVMADLAPRSPGGLAQSLARRFSQDLADRVHDARTASDLDWLEPPDCIHVHGPKAAPVLRYWRDPAVPVTTYAHHLDFNIAGLQPLDRRRLLDRTDRFFAADEIVAADLVAAGVATDRIAEIPDALPRPSLPPPDAVMAERRAHRGLPLDRPVVGVMPVADWMDAPDLTLLLAWEVERLSGAAAPLFHWYGMPDEGEPRWSLDFDIDRIGLGCMQLETADLEWDELVDVVDLVVLPERSTSYLPEGFAELAARRARPVACWGGHPAQAEVQRWGGVVIDQGDAAAMARHLHASLRDAAALHRGREAAWRVVLADVEQFTPLSITLPVSTR